MSLTSFIVKLKKLFPETAWPWLFAALSYDPLVWQSLDGDLGERALERNSNHPEDYSPAALALLALNCPFTLSEVRDGKGVKRDEERLSQSSPLAQAGWLALQLRQQSLEALSYPQTSITPTALACLYGMLPNPAEMLRAVAGLEGTDHASAGLALALHALFSNPLPPEALQEALDELLTDLPRRQRLSLLRLVHAHRPHLAAPLAQTLLNLEQNLNGRGFSVPDQDDPTLADIQYLLRQAEIQRFSPQPTQAIPLLEQAASKIEALQAHLAVQMAQTHARLGDHRSALLAWEQANTLNPNNPEHLSGLILALLQAGRTDQAASLLASQSLDTAHAAIWLARARLFALEHQPQEARDAALKALEAVDDLPEALAADLAYLLFELQQTHAAIRAAERALTLQPLQPDLLALLARARLGCRDAEGAAQAAHLASAFAPERLDLRRLVAECLEANGDPSAALEERQLILERSAAPTPEDWRALAVCALRAGQPSQALEAGNHLLQDSKDDPLALTLVAQAYLENNDITTALEHLQRAVVLAPDQSAPWLALAYLYRRHDQPQKALETLQAAAHACPTAAEVNLALGEAYLAQGAVTQALSTLREAYHLITSSDTSRHSLEYTLFWPQDIVHRRGLRAHIALRLGESLLQAGYLAEARQALETAYQLASSDIEIAQSYARVLLALGEHRIALEPLEAVLRSRPQDVSPYLEYTRCSLALCQKEKEAYCLDNALDAIQRALELSPEHPEATALLAEVLAARNDLLPAMQAYHKALESPLAQEPLWQARLSLGLGELACKLGQIETAIAALQEASQADPTNPRIQRSLSEAYDAAGLSEDAYRAARAALLLAPSDVDNLTWFAAQALNLKGRPGASLPEVQIEAINALERATQLAPQRSDLWVALGQLQLKAGNSQAALTAFRKLAEASDLTPDCTTLDLYQAAQGLLQLGDPGAAIRCLERALQSGPQRETSASPRLLDLLISLSQARRQAGDRHGAVEALDQALALAPNEATLYLDKADLLTELSEPKASQEALACLTTALKLNPHQPELHHRAALIQRAAGDLSMAWMHATQMVENSSASLSLAMQARLLAADLALALLQPDQARLYLQGPLPQATAGEAVDEAILLDYHILKAELALEVGDERVAIEELAHALEIAPEETRLLAIQARLSYQHSDPQAAIAALESALKALGETAQASPSALYANAEAAIELGQWQPALRLCEALVQRLPLEPRSHLILARALVLRAEFQCLAEALQVVRNAPGAQALSEAARQQFEDCLENIANLIKRWTPQPGQDDANLLLRRWRSRGQAIFQPSPENAQALATLPPHPDDVAARIACLRRIGDLNTAGLAARDFPQNPLVLLQLALSLAEEKPRQAMAAIHAAADALEHFTPNRRWRSAFGEPHIAPLIYALMARLFHRNGHRASDRQSALQAIQTALSIWSEEPCWHTLAAEIHLHGKLPKAGEYPNPMPPEPLDEHQESLEAALTHLQQAIQLDPTQASALLLLGQISLQKGDHPQAIHILEQAVQVAGDQVEAWMILAQAYRAAGDLERAASCAERAVTLAPNQIPPLLLRGEIALEAENPRGAQSRAQAVLRIQADHPGALLLLARALNALERPEEALTLLEKALPLAAEPLPLSLERVRLLRRFRGLEPALQAARHLAEHYPDEPGVLSTLAEMLEASGQDEAAIRAAQRALRNPEASARLSSAEQAQLHFLLGRLYHRAGQLDQAVHHLNECLHLTPKTVEAYLELGHVHQERRQHTQALNAFRQAIAVDPNDYRPYYQIGLALKESKDYMGAEKMLRRAAELAPNDPGIHRLLAAVVALNLVHNRRQTPQEAGS